MKSLYIACLIVFLGLVVPAVLCAQPVSLQDSPDYQKGLEYQHMAKEAYDKGEYDSSYEYARQAHEYFAKAKEWVDAELLKFRANSRLEYAKSQSESAQKTGVDKKHPDEYSNAIDQIALADTEYQGENYEQSIGHADEAIRILRSILDSGSMTLGTNNTTDTTDTTDATDTTATTDERVFPKYYVVRLILPNRDCLWKIAGYKFIYNDPYQWKKIYEANKNKLYQVNNPNLIHPKLILEIPSLKGEKREGTYDPAKDYPVME